MEYKQRYVFLFTLGLYMSLLVGCGGDNNSTTKGTGINESPSISSTHSSLAVSSQASSSEMTAVTECQLLNFQKDDVINYKLPIIYGRCPLDIATVAVDVAGTTYELPLADGYFKGVIALNYGANEILLRTADNIIYSNLYYEPSQNSYKVQMIYAVAADDDGHFLAAAGEANDLETAKKRLALQGLMMQSATAEMLYKATGKHLTYALVEDADGAPIVKVLRLPQSRALLLTQTGEDIYNMILDELEAAGDTLARKNMVTMGFSDYVNGKSLGHAALGGGSLGIFGGLHLHTCPGSIEEIITSFSNTTQIDTNFLLDDSVDRGSYWANCATGMGASLHELGHTFDHLFHTDTGIMSRGFDNFNRLFVIKEPGLNKPLTPFYEGGAIWDPASVSVLTKNEWFSQ